MTKSEFLAILKAVASYRVTKKSALCRCVGCCNERRKNQGKTVDASVKAIWRYLWYFSLGVRRMSPPYWYVYRRAHTLLCDGQLNTCHGSCPTSDTPCYCRSRYWSASSGYSSGWIPSSSVTRNLARSPLLRVPLALRPLSQRLSWPLHGSIAHCWLLHCLYLRNTPYRSLHHLSISCHFASKLF